MSTNGFGETLVPSASAPVFELTLTRPRQRAHMGLETFLDGDRIGLGLGAKPVGIAFTRGPLPGGALRERRTRSDEAEEREKQDKLAHDGSFPVGAEGGPGGPGKGDTAPNWVAIA
jgi:hypothetical protein